VDVLVEAWYDVWPIVPAESPLEVRPNVTAEVDPCHASEPIDPETSPYDERPTEYDEPFARSAAPLTVLVQSANAATGSANATGATPMTMKARIKAISRDHVTPLPPGKLSRGSQGVNRTT
jgi:hypothetical protein